MKSLIAKKPLISLFALMLLMASVACGESLDDDTAEVDSPLSASVDADADDSFCQAQDAKPIGLCRMVLGVVFDGRSCQVMSGCECKGSDCDNLFDTVADCEEVYKPCMADDCKPMDVKPVGQCAMVLGVAWGGPDYGCNYMSGCSCDGSDCDDLYSDIESCERDYNQCLPDPICEPWDAKGEGACKMALGYAYDGKECTLLGGCECVGDDCDLLTSTADECKELVTATCG